MPVYEASIPFLVHALLSCINVTLCPTNNAKHRLCAAAERES